MKTNTWLARLNAAFCLVAAAFLPGAPLARAHCDSLDGPVVKAAQRALVEGEVSHALIWVQPDDEAEIRRVFEQTLAVRKLGAEAMELADRYFFETLVRVHRAGEGEPFTGLKPAGRDLGPAIPAGDQALESGDAEPVLHLLADEMKRGAHQHFADAVKRKNFAPQDVAAGREYVRAYVTYIHYVDGVYRAASGVSADHPGEQSGAHEDHAGHEQ
ncbi:MAG TPA: DUF6448 family protein [Opitutaceae bacterium]